MSHSKSCYLNRSKQAWHNRPIFNWHVEQFSQSWCLNRFHPLSFFAAERKITKLWQWKIPCLCSSQGHHRNHPTVNYTRKYHKPSLMCITRLLSSTINTNKIVYANVTPGQNMARPQTVMRVSMGQANSSRNGFGWMFYTPNFYLNHV